MSREEKLKKLAEEVQNISSSVNPSLWGSIGAQVAGTTGASGAAATGLSVTQWIVAVVVGAGLMTAGGVYYNNDNKKEQVLLADQGAQTQVKDDISQNFIDTPITEKNAVLPIKKLVQPKLNQMVLSEEKGIENSPKKVLEKEMPMVTELVQKEFMEDRMPSKSTIKKELIRNKEKAKSVVELMPDVTSSKIIEKHQIDEEEERPEVYQSPAVFKRLPNVFSPNGDGVSDQFFIESEGLEDFSIVIMDLQSNVVWNSADPQAKWNGYGVSGEKVPAGRYMYFIAARDLNGEPLTKTQLLTIHY
jgi:gliding motility-associated-like protein